MNKRGRVIRWIILGLYVWAGVSVKDSLIAAVGGKIGGILVWLLLWYVAQWTRTTLHELGHLLGGRLSGYSFLWLRVGHLLLARKPAGLRLYFLRGRYGGGQCCMLPPRDAGGNFPVTAYHLGGVGVDLVLVPVFLLLWQCSGQAPYWEALWKLMFWCNLITLGANGIPMPQMGFSNDGTNTWLLHRSEKERKCFLRIMELEQAMIQDLRLRQVPEEWFRDTWDPEDPAFVDINCERLMDQGDFAGAQAYMEALPEGEMSLWLRCQLRMKYILCQAVQGIRGAELMKLVTPELETYMRRRKTTINVQRTRYTLALLGHENPKLADICLKQLRKSLKRYPYRGVVQAEEEYLLLLQKNPGVPGK